MENMIRHGENITSILFSTHEIADSQIITYEDNDIRILPDERNQIFDRIYGKYTKQTSFLPKTLSITRQFVQENGK